MYTYRKPFYRPITTKESIEYRAKRELYHAIRMGNAVGFIGSGVTMGYGRLNYNELVRLLLLRAIDELDRWRIGERENGDTLSLQSRDIERLATSLALQLDQTLADNSNARSGLRADFAKPVETSTALLEVLNELAEALGQPDMLAEEVARLFQTRPLDQFDARLRLLGGGNLAGDCSLHKTWISHVIGKKGRNFNKDKYPRFVEHFQRHMPVAPENAAKPTITQAFEKALRDCGVNDAVRRSKNIYDELCSDFKEVEGKHGGFLYVPVEAGGSGEPPNMQQVVIGIWALLAAAVGQVPKENLEFRPKVFRAIFFSLAHLYNLDDIALCDWPDPIDGIVRALGLRRLLTVNYDLELERYFRRRFGVDFQSDRQEIDAGHGLPRSEEEDREIHFSGMGVRLVRAEMQKTSTSELLDFAIPHDEDIHLYYLHGRSDTPQQMRRDRLIISESDYQKHYLENNQVRRSFDEGLRALFAANTVIFLGIGMSEPDLLRPLRQFVSDDQKWRRTSGGPIVVLNSQGLVKDERRAVELNVNFGAKALFYNPILRFERQGRQHKLEVKPLDDLAKAFTDAVAAVEKSSKFGDEAEDGTIDVRTRKAVPNSNDSLAKLKETIGKNLDTLKAAAAFAKEHLGMNTIASLECDSLGLSATSTLTAEQAYRLLLINGYLGRVKTYVISHSLTELLRQIEPDRGNWLREWRRLPDQRISRFVDWRDPENQKDIERCLWIRQRIKHSGGMEPTKAEDCKHFVDLCSALHADIDATPEKSRFIEFAAKAEHGRRIVRIAGPRGVGKGALIHAIQLGYHKLFQPNTPMKRHYAGAFFADARYSTEFNSVLTSLVRFVAGRTVQIGHDPFSAVESTILKRASEAETEVFGDGTGSRYKKLDFCFDALTEQLEIFFEKVKTSFSGNVENGGQTTSSVGHMATGAPPDRLLICLSGIERLFTNSGQAYQPVHGAFFRHLCSQDFAKFPIDIIFVVGHDNPQELFDLSSRQNNQSTTGDNESADGSNCPSEATTSNPKALTMSDSQWWTMESTSPQDRFWIPKNLEKGDLRDRTMETFRSLIMKKRGQISNAYREIHTIYATLKDSTVIHMWLMHLIQERWRLVSQEPDPNKTDDLIASVNDYLKELIDRLEVAACEGHAAVIEQIMNSYRELDEPRASGQPRAARPSDLEVHDEVMRHLAFFSVPIERSVLASCPRIIALAQRDTYRDKDGKIHKIENTERGIAQWLQGFLNRLYRRRMIIRLFRSRARTNHNQDYQPPEECDDAHVRYYLHSRMREHISRQMKFDLFEFGEHSYFNLSMFAAQPKDLPSPRSHDYKFVGDILHRLIRVSRLDIHPFFHSKDPKKQAANEDKLVAARYDRLAELDTPYSTTRRIRAAQSLLAGSFSIGVITRFDNPQGVPDGVWESEKPFENYDGWLRSLINSANAVDVTKSEYCKAVNEGISYTTVNPLKFKEGAPKWTPITDVTRPFYPNEIAWLFNERGLCKLVQGRVNEALTLFEQAEDLLRTLRWQENDPDEVSYSALRVLRLNKAVALIEHGRSVDARPVLESIKSRKISEDRRPVALTPHVARGYLGLIHHLQGRLDAAEANYEEAIKFTHTYDIPRAASIFMKHQADLYRGTGDYEKAEDLVTRAIYEANSTRQMDVFHLGRISLARLRYRQNPSDTAHATELLNEATIYAERLGIPKIQVEVDTFYAQILIENGDLDAAGACLVKAIATASRFGMNLRKITAVQNYVRLADAREDTKLVKRLRRKLTDLTEKFNHQLHTNQVKTFARIEP